jgi:serine/threonine protein kinase
MPLVNSINENLNSHGYFKFKIKINDNFISFKIDKYLSSGAEANVYNISEIDNSVLSEINVVAKVIESKHEKNELQKLFLNINHQNIEKLYFLYERNDFSLLICEKLDITLSDFAFENGNKKKQVLYVASEIVEALIFLHTRCKIAHCDIKENNIMFSLANKRFKLIDFNNCTHETEFEKFKMRINLFRKHVQLLKDSKNWGYNVDIWALGTTLYSLYYDKELLLESRIKFRRSFKLDNFQKKTLINFYEKKIDELLKKRNIFYYFLTLSDIVLLKSKLLSFFK